MAGLLYECRRRFSIALAPQIPSALGTMRHLLLFLASTVFAADFPAPSNSGNDKDRTPTPAAEALTMIKVPPGFRAQCFASEPMVQNPIASAWDARGRLWVAENYTYAEQPTNFDKTFRDRIIILEDTDGDGVADKRTVFADDLQNLTSIELGYGGVFVTAAPNLLFIPDRDADDKPDGPAVILLDGFDAWSVRHNFVNGLKWGPDGWLYGRHGIQATSRVGAPGTPDLERVTLNCGIWRFHPVRHTFEVVCWGGTNPWGLDWNAEGEGFFTNTVTGHLYHVIPGAHYERMYGEDPNPHIYQLLPQTADHYHYDRTKSWTDSRDGKANDLGGGHAHTGCMIYQGDNWPAEYRGKLFTINLHGHRLNCERLERNGAGYTAKHEPDVMFFGDPWFRGVDLTTGPDGSVFVLDWCDDGECHENDGVHRTSGRIWKITYGEGKKNAVAENASPELKAAMTALSGKGDLSALSDEQLVTVAMEASEWQMRIATRLLAERAIRVPGPDDFSIPIEDIALDEEQKLSKRLRAIRLLTATGEGLLITYSQLMNDKAGLVRAAAVNGFIDKAWQLSTTLRGIVPGAAQEKVGIVLLAAFSNLDRCPDDIRFELATALASNKWLRDDAPLFSHLCWGGLAPYLSGQDAKQAQQVVTVAYGCVLPLVLEYTARRVTEDLAKLPDRLDGLLALATTTFDEGKAASITRGISAGLRGVTKAKAPASWGAFSAKASAIPALADKIRTLNVIFGDGRALDEIRAVALDAKADIASRRQAVQTLVQSKPADLRATLEKLVGDNDLLAATLQGLASFDDPAAGALIVSNFKRVRADARPGVIAALCSRAAFAGQLLDAIAAGKLTTGEITPYHARQIAALGDAALTAKLGTVWGTIASPADLPKRIAEWRAKLPAETLAKADLASGHTLFAQTCGACHKLNGEGGDLAPDLTGGGRSDLGYLLENILAPSAVVPAGYRLNIIELKDGRVLSGFIAGQNDTTLTLRTMTETQTLERASIAKTTISEQSLMPEGLLNALTPDQVRDLLGYVMKK